MSLQVPNQAAGIGSQWYLIHLAMIDQLKAFLHDMLTDIVEQLNSYNNTHAGGVERNKILLKSSAWFISGACFLYLISPNRRCKALSSRGKNDSWLHFVWRTFPASTISLSLDLCFFFHVDSMDWLKLNCLHSSILFIPQSNLPSIWIFSLMVWSVCWHLGFERNTLKCNPCRKKGNTVLYCYECIYFSYQRSWKNTS